MQNLTTREKQLMLRVFDACSMIAHKQAGSDEMEGDGNVTVVWKIAAIVIHQEIEKAKFDFLRDG